MANHAFALDLNPAQNRVEVAIGGGGDHLQAVARSLTLRPKLVAGAAEEGYVAGLQSFFVGRAIHEAQHQDLAGCGVLYDGRRQAAHFVEIDFYRHLHHSFRKNKNPAEVVSAGSGDLVIRNYPVISADTFATW